MKQLYLLPLSLILMIQGFGNDPLLQEKEVENFTGSVILAPDEAGLELEEAQKIVSINTEKFHLRDAISDNEYDDSNDDDNSDDGNDDENDVSFEYDEESDDSFISIDAPPSPDDAPAMPKSQKVVPAPVKEGSTYGNSDNPAPLAPKAQKVNPAPAKEGASYGITDIPPPATPESKPAMPTPRKEESTYRAPNAPAQAKPQGAALKRPSQQVKPAEATVPEQSQTTRRDSAQRRQQPARAQSEQASAADSVQQSPSTRQAPARRRQQPARAQSEQASSADTAQQPPSTRQTPARRRQQPARAQSEQASAADTVQQSPSTRQTPVRRRQQPARAQSEQASAADTVQQPPSTRQTPARRRQQPARAQSEQASAADTVQQSPSTRQAPARRRQQPVRAQSEQASAADTVQQSPSTQQTPARRRQQPVRAQSEQASAASKAEQKPASARQPSAQLKQQPPVSQRTQRSSSPRQSSSPVETAQAEDDAMQRPARTTPRQRAYYQSSPRNTREQGRLQAQSNGANMGTPYTQKINQSSMQPSGPKENSPSQLPQAINMPARPVVQDGWNLWILGEALLWQAVQENMEYIYKGHDGSNNSRFRDIKKPHFDWDWGWRFGAGYNIPRDGWDLSLIWTHIENRAKGTTHAGDESLDIVWSVAAYHVPSPTVAHAHWEAHLDQVDLDLGRQFYVGRHLTLHPKAGMRSSWIFQEYDVHWTGTQGTQKAHMTDKFWGLGFFAGLDSDWMLGWGFSLFGDAGLAVLLGYFDVDQHGTFNGATNSKIKDSFRTGRPIFDLDLGLKWAKKIYSDRFALAFKVGYEYHLYFNQNQFLLSNGNDGFELFNPVNGDLTYQGVTFSGQFDF